MRRLHCGLFFLAAGVGIGGWAASLPLLSAKAALPKGQLGLVLLCFALGAIVLMINVGRYIDRVISSNLLSFLGGLTFAASIMLVPVFDNAYAIGGIVFLAGAGFGTLDVSMNTEASAIERQSGRHLMSSFHAVFSLGNIAGAILIGFLASHSSGLAVCLSGTGLLVLILIFVTRLIDTAAPSIQPVAGGSASVHVPSGISPRILVLTLGVIAFLSLLAEGGLMDWTAIYLVDNMGVSESLGAYAFAVFAAAMTIGRLCGDFATSRIGHVRLILLGGIVSALSLMILILTTSVAVVLVALACCGLSVANLVPAVFAAAGRAGLGSAGKAIATVTTMGYSGLLLGPALLGFVAQISSLTISFVVITVAFLLVVLIASAIGGLRRGTE